MNQISPPPCPARLEPRCAVLGSASVKIVGHQVTEEGRSVVSLDNPVLNGPYDPPQQHFALTVDGTPTGQVLPGRRPSESFIPIAPSRKGRKAQTSMNFNDDIVRESNSLINDIRRSVETWAEVVQQGGATTNGRLRTE